MIRRQFLLTLLLLGLGAAAKTAEALPTHSVFSIAGQISSFDMHRRALTLDTRRGRVQVGVNRHTAVTVDDRDAPQSRLEIGMYARIGGRFDLERGVMHARFVRAFSVREDAE
jgi:hypothetical protein